MQEGEFEREGYGQRPYDNFETVMFSCERQVRRAERVFYLAVNGREACTAHGTQ